jgi:hypothetical protein
MPLLIGMLVLGVGAIAYFASAKTPPSALSLFSSADTLGPYTTYRGVDYAVKSHEESWDIFGSGYLWLKRVVSGTTGPLPYMPGLKFGQDGFATAADADTAAKAAIDAYLASGGLGH